MASSHRARWYVFHMSPSLRSALSLRLSWAMQKAMFRAAAGSCAEKRRAHPCQYAQSVSRHGNSVYCTQTVVQIEAKGT